MQIVRGRRRILGGRRGSLREKGGRRSLRDEGRDDERRKGKGTAICLFRQLRQDCGRLSADAAALCLVLGEGIVRSCYGVKGTVLLRG